MKKGHIVYYYMIDFFNVEHVQCIKNFVDIHEEKMQ